MAAGCGTLHGVVVGRGLVAREAAAMAGTVPAARGALWDGRFSVRFAPPGGAIGGAGTVLETGTRRLRRRRGLPSVVATVLPALSFGTDLLVIPHLAYPNAETCLTVGVDFRPPRRWRERRLDLLDVSHLARDALGPWAPYVELHVTRLLA